MDCNILVLVIIIIILILIINFKFTIILNNKKYMSTNTKQTKKLNNPSVVIKSFTKNIVTKKHIKKPIKKPLVPMEPIESESIPTEESIIINSNI